MYISILNKNSIGWLGKLTSCAFLAVGMSSCSSSCGCQDKIEIPCEWQTLLTCEMNSEDPSCFVWWEALNDPLFTTLIERASCRNKDVRLARLASKDAWIKTLNSVSIEVAKSYIELRGLQMRLRVLEANIESQQAMLVINEGLSNRGFFSSIKENEDKRNINSLLTLQSDLELSEQKLIFHLSTLLSCPPGFLADRLCQPRKLPDICGCFPVGCPMDLLCSPVVQEVQKGAARNGEARLYYHKTLLTALESAEIALSEFRHEQNSVHYLENSKQLKEASYQLVKDLYAQGLKDDQDAFFAYQDVLSEEDALIQGKIKLLMSFLNIYEILGNAWTTCSY